MLINQFQLLFYGFIAGAVTTLIVALLLYIFVFEPVFNELHVKIKKLKKRLGEEY